MKKSNNKKKTGKKGILKQKIRKRKIEKEFLVIGVLVWVMFTILNTASLVSFREPLLHSLTSAAVGTASVTISAGTATVAITNPQNSTVYNQDDDFNVTAAITASGGNTLDCNATILISNPSTLNLTSPATQDISNLVNGNPVIVSWNITAQNVGTSDITVYTNCTLGASDSDKITNITVSGVTYNFTLSFGWDIIPGKPVKVNVSSYDSGNSPAPNATIRITETNGWSAFAQSQVDPSNLGLKVYSIAESRTNAQGFANLTLMPTGGYEAIDQYVGPYNLSAEMLINGAVVASQAINWTQRSIPDPNGTKYKVYHQSYIQFARDKYLRIYRLIYAWLAKTGGVDGGENFVLTIYTNNTDNGVDINVTSGKPIGLRLTVRNDSTGSAIPNATVRITEYNGWSMFAPMQEWTDSYGGTGMSAKEIGEIQTDTNGQINFTFVATGGYQAYETNLGQYSAVLETVTDGTTVYSKQINVTDRTLPDVPAGAAAETIPNASYIRFVRDKILRLYRTLYDWLDYS